MKINKKIMLLILAVCMILPLLIIAPASASVNAGDIYNFEIIKNGGDGKNVVDRVTNEPLSGANNSFGHIVEFSFANVKQYITSDGATEACTKFYFRAASNNSDLAEVGSRPMNGEEYFFDNGMETTSDSKNYLALRVPANTTEGGYVVINVWVSTVDPNCAPVNSLQKSFTIKVVDDSRDGDIDIKVKNGTADIINNKITMPCNGISATLNIDQIIGYDFSDGVNSTTEKLITYYTWTAASSNSSVVKITDASDPAKLTAEGKVEANSGNKSIRVTPLNPGTARIIIEVTPDAGYENYAGNPKYPRKVTEIIIEVTDYIGGISFTAEPVKDLYLIDNEYSAGREVEVEFSINDLKINKNGNDVFVDSSETVEFKFNETDNLKFLSGPNDFADITSGFDGAGETFPAMSHDQRTFAGTGEGGEYIFKVRLIPQRNADNKNVLTYSTTFSLKVHVMDGENIQYTKTVSSTTITFNLYDGSKEGEIYDFKITQAGLDDYVKYPGGTKTIADKEYVYGYVDKKGAAQETLEFLVSEVRVYGAVTAETASEDDLLELVYPGGYTLAVASDNTGQKYINPYLSDDPFAAFNGATPFSVKPKAVCTSAKVFVTVAVNNDTGTKTNQREFWVKVSNIGVLPDEEGTIVRVDILAGKEKVYDGKEFYLKNDTANALELNLSKVYTADSTKASTNYMAELKNYEWTVEITKNIAADPRIPENPNKAQGFASDYDNKYIYIEGARLSGEDSNSITKRVLPSNTDSEKSIVFSTGWYPTIWMPGDGNNVQVTLTVKALNADGSETEKSSYSINFTIYTSEMGGQFLPVIDYENEIITIVENRRFELNGNQKVYKDDLYVFKNADVQLNGETKYMYCLNAAADGASQAGEKWYPFYGSEMDISKYIPKNERSRYRIAIRPANAVSDDNINFTSGVRVAAEIPGRRAIDNAAKKQFAYENGKIAYKGGDAVKVDYRIGLSGWDGDVITSVNGIQVSPAMNPAGNTVEIKLAADPENSKFASVSFKVKVPKAGKKPLIKDDGKKKFSGFSHKLLWSAAESGSTWTVSPKGSIPYASLATEFPGLTSTMINGAEYYLLYVKTAATNTAAESEIAIIPIPAAKYKTK